MTLVFFVVLPIVVGVLIYAVPKLPITVTVAVAEIALTVLLLHTYPLLGSGSVRQLLGAEDSIMGILLTANSFTLALVGLSVMLFSLSFVYSMGEAFFDRKFVMLFLILQGLLCGVFLTDDLFNIYVLLEVATVVVAILIMFRRDSRSTYDGMVYLLSQIICMLFYLFGIGYMYKIFGVLSIEQIREMVPYVPPHQLVLPFSFIMSAVCLKSAFFPLFSWLPHAHGTPSAPSAVSAILSGLYVKNGIYLFYLFSNLFAPAVEHMQYFTVIGVVTAVLGFMFAVSQTDVKLILAYHTISQIGLIAVGLTSGSDVSTVGALYHIICHALFKSLLFLSAGMIIHRYKTRDIRSIHGVMRTMPVAGITTVFGILGITGAPFFNGSVSKYFMVYGVKGTVTEYLILIINIGTILSFVKYSHMLWGKGPSGKESSDPRSAATVLILSAMCLLGGVFGSEIIEAVFGVQLSIDPLLYAEKARDYLVSVICAFLFYRYILSKTTVHYRFGKMSLGFRQIVLAIILFFVATEVIMTMQFISK